jgi:hemerythrin HHE cation binding domain-containing protein
MTITDPQLVQPSVSVVVDLYRDIHKAIRTELFDVILTAGRIDPADTPTVTALAAHVGQVADLLVAHAGHEDPAINPPLEVHRPDLAERIADDHHRLEARIDGLRDVAAAAVDAEGADQRRRVHHLYLELASFTSTYLAHQDFEERVVMPALEAALGVDGVVAIHQQIVGGIPPAEMAATLPIMLQSMNVDDRTELLGGMYANAPAEKFAGVWGLTRTVLSPADFAQVASRLGLS